MTLRLALLASIILGLLITSTGCGVKYAKPKSELPELPADYLDTWIEVEIKRPLPGNSTRQPTRFFSMMLPPDWTVRQPLLGADSWVGFLMGEDMKLSIQGGPFAVSDLAPIVGGEPTELDPELTKIHVLTEESVSGVDAIFVRPQQDRAGLTGAKIKFPRGRIFIRGIDLTREQQSIAFEIIRSLKR